MREREFEALAIGVLITVLLVAATGTAAAQYAPRCSTVDYDGEGTEANPYEVENVDQLQCIEEQSLGANYRLVSDIDASETSEWDDGAGFEPVGGFDDQFTGTFDGANHTITGLTIDRPNGDDIGLFGAVDENGTVENTNLSDAEVTGSERVGSLVGQNEGVVRRSSASGTVTSTSEEFQAAVGGLVGINRGTVERSSASANVRWTGDVSVDSQGSRSDDGTEPPDPPPSNFGGLIGLNTGGTVSESYATGSVSGDGSVGGFVGSNAGDGTITESYATGDVEGNSLVGGFVGMNGEAGTIKRSYSMGDVKGTQAGGFVSWNFESSTIKHSYAAGEVTGSPAGGFAMQSKERGGKVIESYWDVNATCQSYSSGAIGLTTSEMTGDNASENMEGFNFTDTWRRTSGYPDLAWQEGNSSGEVKEVECDAERDDNGDSDGSNGDGENNASNESSQPTPGFTAVAALVAFIAGIAVMVKQKRR
jgi:hypothetical protein